MYHHKTKYLILIKENKKYNIYIIHIYIYINIFNLVLIFLQLLIFFCNLIVFYIIIL